jgi:hypothetical protein
VFVLRLARENPGSGYQRIVGDLAGVGVRVSATTVAKILRQAGELPAGTRARVFWREFLRAHAESIIACDFFTLDKFSRSFDEVFRSEGVETIRTPFRAPKANAFAERWVGTVRRDCLDWFLITSRGQLERVLRVYVNHYNTHRPHRALGLRPPTQPSSDHSSTPRNRARFRRSISRSATTSPRSGDSASPKNKTAPHRLPDSHPAPPGLAPVGSVCHSRLRAAHA